MSDFYLRMALPKIIVDNNCAKRIVTNLTWKERLLSWPWRPWVKETISYEPEMWVVEGTIVCHPALYDTVRRTLESN